MEVQMEYTAISCGVIQMYGVGSRHASSPEDLLKAIAYKLDNYWGGVLICSDRDRGPDNQSMYLRLAEKIRECGLGIVTLSPFTKNLNSGNDIFVMVWNINFNAFAKWCNKNMKKGSVPEWTTDPCYLKSAL